MGFSRQSYSGLVFEPFHDVHAFGELHPLSGATGVHRKQRAMHHAPHELSTTAQCARRGKKMRIAGVFTHLLRANVAHSQQYCERVKLRAPGTGYTGVRPRSRDRAGEIRGKFGWPSEGLCEHTMRKRPRFYRRVLHIRAELRSSAICCNCQHERQRKLLCFDEPWHGKLIHVKRRQGGCISQETLRLHRQACSREFPRSKPKPKKCPSAFASLYSCGEVPPPARCSFRVLGQAKGD